MENETQEQINNSRPWLYKKGQSGNPGGRPKGSKSLKTYIQERFQSMTDEEREDFLDGLPKEIIWKMGEGNPKQDVDSKVEGTLTVIVPPQVAQAFNINGTDTETGGSNT